MSTTSGKTDGFSPADLQGDFFDHSEDQIGAAGALLDRLERGAGDATSALAEFRRIAHSLKGRGTMFEMPSVSAVAARLEDYMAGLALAAAADVAGIRRHFDLLDAIVDARRDLAEPELSRRLAALPTRRAGAVKG
jgi:chemotaxis protein histidine kinase CheA